MPQLPEPLLNQTRPFPRRRAGGGSVSVEMVILAPVMVVLMLFVVYLGRAGGSIEQIRHAADAGARAASIVNRPRMASVAELVAAADLSSNGVNCSSTTIGVSLAGTAGSQSVTVSVTCDINTQGISMLAIGSRSLAATSTEVVDRFRGDG